MLRFFYDVMEDIWHLVVVKFMHKSQIFMDTYLKRF